MSIPLVIALNYAASVCAGCTEAPAPHTFSKKPGVKHRSCQMYRSFARLRYNSLKSGDRRAKPEALAAKEKLTNGFMSATVPLQLTYKGTRNFARQRALRR
jgi:hypothetical protein